MAAKKTKAKKPRKEPAWPQIRAEWRLKQQEARTTYSLYLRVGKKFSKVPSYYVAIPSDCMTSGCMIYNKEGQPVDNVVYDTAELAIAAVSLYLGLLAGACFDAGEKFLAKGTKG